MPELGGSNSQEIGGVHYRVGVVGAEQAKAAVDQTAASVQNLGNTAQAATPKINAAVGSDSSGGLRGFASTLKGFTKPARDAIGAIVGTIGAFTRMLGIIGLITGAVAGLVSIWKRYNTIQDETGEKLAKVNKELGSMVEQANKIAEALSKITPPPNSLLGFTPEHIKETADAIKKNEEAIARLVNSAEKLRDRPSLLGQLLFDEGTGTDRHSSHALIEAGKNITQIYAEINRLQESNRRLREPVSAAAARSRAELKAIRETTEALKEQNEEWEHLKELYAEDNKEQNEWLVETEKVNAEIRRGWAEMEELRQEQNDREEAAAKKRLQALEDERAAVERLLDLYADFMQDFRTQQSGIFPMTGGRF